MAGPTRHRPRAALFSYGHHLFVFDLFVLGDAPFQPQLIDDFGVGSIFQLPVLKFITFYDGKYDFLNAIIMLHQLLPDAFY